MKILFMFGALAMSVGCSLLIAWLGGAALFELLGQVCGSEARGSLKAAPRESGPDPELRA